MLSRVAEALFWTGRYLERAEDIARLLDVHGHAVLEDPWVDEAAACRELLQVMGVASGEEPTMRGVTRRLAFCRQDASSIAGALVAARENARTVREALSSELWESVNSTFHALAGHEESAARLGAHPFLWYVRDRVATMTGLIEGTMPHDDGWRFLVLGRSLERVDMSARLLSAWGQREATQSWVELLKCASGYEAYLRVCRVPVERQRVVEFLVTDRLFPRSVFAALTRAEECLDGLDASPGRPPDDEARRLLGRARTNLEFLRPDELLGQLPGLLGSLQWTCAAAGEALTARWFHPRPFTSWALDPR